MTFGQVLKHLNTVVRFLFDSFPIVVRHNTRMGRYKMPMSKAYYGRCASKRSWFYRVKIYVIMTVDSLPVDYPMHPGSDADMTGLRQLHLDLFTGSVLYTDEANTGYAHG